MNTRSSVGVMSAWESGISALSAWANPVVREVQSVAELNLHLINRLNGEALKTLSTISRTRSLAELPAVQWSAASDVVRLFADYGSELGRIVSRINETLQDVAHAQAEKNEVLVRSVMDACQSRTNAATAAVTSAFETALSAEPNAEALAQQETEQAIAVARAARPAAGTRSRKAVVE